MSVTLHHGSEPLPDRVRLMEAQAEEFARDVEDKATAYTVLAVWKDNRRPPLQCVGPVSLDEARHHRDKYQDESAPLMRVVCALVPVSE